MRDDKFTVGLGDLNGDGKLDLIVLYQGTMWGGSGGCTSVAVLATPDGYSSKSINLPNFVDHVTILLATHKGMHALRFDDASHVFRWNGKDYEVAVLS